MKIIRMIAQVLIMEMHAADTYHSDIAALNRNLSLKSEFTAGRAELTKDTSLIVLINLESREVKLKNLDSEGGHFFIVNGPLAKGYEYTPGDVSVRMIFADQCLIVTVRNPTSLEKLGLDTTFGV